MTIWDFFNNHWFLAICAMITICALAKGFYWMFNRLMRTIKVAIRGWPPSHLDADGDWKED